MSTRTIHFNGMTISAIDTREDGVTIHFSRAIIVKNMEGAEQDTRWHGQGRIDIEEPASTIGGIPTLPTDLVGADIRDNQITYRDEIVMPFTFHGLVGITLRFPEGSGKLGITGEKISLALSEHEKYIEHI